MQCKGDDAVSDETVIRYCAPTLAAIKTGSLFACVEETEQALHESVLSLNRRLCGKGLCILALHWREVSRLMYVCRPRKLACDLKQPRAQAILRGCGYPCGQVNDCLRLLAGRLRTQEEFPHEIGLFLGYPPEDVEGFMKGSHAKCVGCWKVYGDAERAQRLFARYARCTSVYLRQYAQGVSIERLTVRS